MVPFTVYSQGGTSVSHMLVYTLGGFTCLLLHNLLYIEWFHLVGRKSKVLFEIVTVVFTYVLGITVLADYINIATTLTFCLTLCLFVHIISWPMRAKHENQPIIVENEKPASRLANFHTHIANQRAIIVWVTALCILAVDTNAMPRYLAKTASGGYSLMDSAVGFYVIMQGEALAMSARYRTHSHTTRSVLLGRALPLFVLGVGRFLLVHALADSSGSPHHSATPEHVEYGAHWNFFFTLAAVNLVALGARHMGVSALLLTAAMCAAPLHYVWADVLVPFCASRLWLLEANQPAVASLAGFASLYCYGVWLAARRSLGCCRVWDTCVCAAAAVFCYCLHACVWGTASVWRARANLGYVLATVCVYTVMQALSLIVDLCTQLALKLRAPCGHHLDSTLARYPQLFSCTNSHALLHFCVANLLTGVVNSLWPHLYLWSTLAAIILLAAYVCLLAALVCFLNRRSFSSSTVK